MKPGELLERFVAPLVEGGAVHVGAPLGAAGLERLLATKPPPELEGRIAEARLAIARGLLLNPIPPQLDVASLRLAVALHDLLFLLHPSATSLLVRDKRVQAVATHAAALARLPPTRDSDELVARHTMLHAFPSLARTDVRVSFWAGKQEFHGQEPPARLKAWPSIRQVREERWRSSCFAEAAAHPLGLQVVRALYEGSPLTDLLHVGRGEPKLSLARLADVLVEPEVCRSVAYQLLDGGVERIAAPIAQAAIAVLDEPPARARFALAFVAHLHLCVAIAPPRVADHDLRAEVLRIAALGDAQGRDFFGLYAALSRAAPDLRAPPDLRRDRRMSALLDEYALACEAAAGTTRVVELTIAVAKAAGATQPSLPTLQRPPERGQRGAT